MMVASTMHALVSSFLGMRCCLDPQRYDFDLLRLYDSGLILSVLFRAKLELVLGAFCTDFKVSIGIHHTYV